MILKGFLKCIILVSLTGCQAFSFKADPPPPVTITEIKTVPLKVYQPPSPAALQLHDVKWFVLTEENLEEKLQEIRDLQIDGVVVFAITPDDYEKMAGNLQEVKRYVNQQKNLILYYRKATTSEKDSLAEDWNSLSEQGN